MDSLKYLSPEWTREALTRIREAIPPDKMKNLTSSMITYYRACPDGKDRALYYKFVDGRVEELSVVAGENAPAAEFGITGDYQTFARISRAELNARAALMTGKLKLRGSLVKALSLAPLVDRMNKVLSGIPTEY